MTEFECRADLRRQLGDECVEHREILLEVRRQLEQQRAKLVAQAAGHLTEPADERGDVLQPAVMRDPPRRLQRQFVRRWRLRRPPGDQLLVRHPVERVVDLDRGKAGGIVRQHLGGGQIARIETAFPFGIVVAGGSDPDHVVFGRGYRPSVLGQP